MQINDRVMLVRLAISMPGNSRRDKAVTAEVIREKNMSGNAGKWMKLLYPEGALDGATEAMGAARTYHYAHSLPWTDEGWRILLAALRFEYREVMKQHAAKFDAAAEAFLAKYDEWVSWAREAHNGTFNPSDYPGVEKTRKKFGFATDFQPIPSGKDFRVDPWRRLVMQRRRDAAMAMLVHHRLITGMISPLE